MTASDFPTRRIKKGYHGQQIENILAKALTQSAAVHILDVCDAAYAEGKMSISHYSFVHLAFATFERPNSYRQIRVSDLCVTTSGHYFIDIVTSKTGEEYPSKVTRSINEPLGLLLQKQRQHVIETYGHMVTEKNIMDLALFPSRALMHKNTKWKSNYSNENFGVHESSYAFHQAYAKDIKNRYFSNDKLTLGANALRHTVGTQLAHSGASAKAIQGVLKHASPGVCRAYVDIAFYGMIDELSESMRPAFTEHLPALINFSSKADPAPPEKQVITFDLETGKFENTGECGKSIACANAPIVCYGCVRFVPFWDADHSINLRIVESEIADMSKRGKPFRHMVERARTAKNKIIIVMNAADRYRQGFKSTEDE